MSQSHVAQYSLWATLKLVSDRDGEVASVVVVAEVVCIVAKEGLLETSNGLTTISASKLQPVHVQSLNIFLMQAARCAWYSNLVPINL